MKRDIVNLTPHDVIVRDDYGNVFTYPSSGHVARVQSNYEAVEVIEGIPIEIETEPTLDFGIDKIDDNTLYIVSYQFALKLKQINHSKMNQFVYPSSYKARRQKNNWKNILSVPSLVACKL